MGNKRRSKYENKFASGHKFGHWQVITGQIVGSPATIEVKCVCGHTKFVDVYTLIKGKSISCGCVRVGENAPNWKGVKGVANTTLSRLLGTSNVSAQYAAHVYNVQSGHCALTGQTLTATSARVAPIDPTLPLSGTNVMLVHNSISSTANALGALGTVSLSNQIVSNTSTPNNIFDKLGFKPNGD
jgi:hypothetical protein